MKSLKSKQANYVLGAAVVLIWGIIIRNIVIATQGGDEPIVNAVPVKKEAYNDFSPATDTASLQLNYRDPFLTAEPDTVLSLPVKKNAALPLVANKIVPVNWGFIKYSGYVHNPGAKSRVALVTINNKMYMMKEGDTEAGVRLVRNLLDSIQVSQNGKTAFIRIK